MAKNSGKCFCGVDLNPVSIKVPAAVALRRKQAGTTDSVFLERTVLKVQERFQVCVKGSRKDTT